MLRELILLFCVVQICPAVRVILKDGKSGTVAAEAERGEAYTFVCNGQTSGTDPKLEWLFSKDSTNPGTHYVYNGVSFDEEGIKYDLVPAMNLIVKDLQPEDTGFYKCRVVVAGDSPSVDEATYNFTVLVPPYKEVSCGFPSDLKITIGKQAEFHCREKVAEAVPAPTYEWYKNNVKLPENPPRTGVYANTSYSYSQNNGRLMFTKVTRGDAGTYYCVVRNKVGNSQCGAAEINTKEENVGAIVGIVFAVIFGLLLICVLIWWTWRRGYCDGFFDSKEPEDDGPDDGANDIMLDGHGPLVTKEPSEWSNGTSNKQEASMMI